MESDNVSAVSRMYSRAMPFPWSWIGPYKLKEDAAARVGHLKRQGPTEYTHEVRQGLRELRPRASCAWPHTGAGQGAGAGLVVRRRTCSPTRSTATCPQSWASSRTFSDPSRAPPRDCIAWWFPLLLTQRATNHLVPSTSPTTLDAVVFGHLAVHYYVPLPTARLRALLASA